jgi:hypothetical protein
LFQRQNILETAPPYTAMRLIFEAGGLLEGYEHVYTSPSNAFPALTDIGFLALVSTGTADVEVDFEILVVDD